MEESIVERVLKLMDHYGLTASEFADKIDVQRSSMSHLVSGRNKPSLDFIQKILNNFSDINPVWLIMGSGPMKQLDLFDTKGDVAPAVPIPAKEIRTADSMDTEVIGQPVKHALHAESIRAIIDAPSIQTDTEAIPQPVPQLSETSKPVIQTIQPALTTAAVIPPAQPIIPAPETVIPAAMPISAVQHIPEQIAPIHGLTEKSIQNDKKVTKIVFFYSDNTFETFNPQ